MFDMRASGWRLHTILLCGALLLTSAARVSAEPKPLSKEEQVRVDEAIDKGVEFLKKVQTKEGDFGWKMYDLNMYQVGQCALPAYALLESGVPMDDPAIQKAAAFLRPRAAIAKDTYDLTLAILFFDRLGDPKDKKLIQACALRLIAGQRRTGGWAYRCPILDDKNAVDLLDCLAELNKRRKKGGVTRNQALQGMEVPLALQGLTVFQDARRLPWQEPPHTGETFAAALGQVVLDGRTDNSNTQFALLGLWAARRHDVAVEPALEISVERFERYQIEPDGFWKYGIDGTGGDGTSRNSMTCVGLIGLAIGRGLKLPTPGSPDGAGKDFHVLRGLAALSRRIGKPIGDMKKQRGMRELYFLWSVERAAMLFGLSDIGGKDWYRWGAESLVVNQKKGGWWPDAHAAEKLPSITYKATICTSFALLFLKRSHPMKDLTATLPFTAKELNEGIARLRTSDKFPLRTAITPGVRKGSTPDPRPSPTTAPSGRKH